MSILTTVALFGCGGDKLASSDAGTDAGRDAGGRDQAASGGGTGTGGRTGTGGSIVSGTGGTSAGGAGAGGSGGLIGSGGTSGVPGTGGTLGATGGSIGPGSGGAGAGGRSGTGGTVGTGGTGEVPGTGRGGSIGAGGVVGTGGARTGGAGTGGAGTGGAGTGGAGTGGAGTGGASTGGASTGGASTGGTSTGGASTGGASTGGASTGGAGTGGAATGGAGTGGAGTGGAGTGGAGTGGAGAATGILYVVAHPDDDLLFVNPDLEVDILAGRRVYTVYVTSGDASGVWQDRERQVLSAHAAMAGVADTWACATANYAGKPTVRCSLTPHPLVTSIFIRIPDGSVRSLWDTGGPGATVDGATTFTRAELLATLVAIQAELQPVRVGALDPTLVYWDGEHEDHTYSAIFALEAARADGIARAFVMYRGYTTYHDGGMDNNSEPRNLSAAQHTEKARIMSVYSGGGTISGIYDEWCWRHYFVTTLTGGPGPIHSSNGQCLEASGTSDGSAVRTAACTGASAQIWTVAGSGRIVEPGGRCLGVGANGTTAVVEACTGAADQHWSLLSNGQLRGTSRTCLGVSGTDVGSGACQSQNTPVNVPWPPVASQRWNL